MDIENAYMAHSLRVKESLDDFISRSGAPDYDFGEYSVWSGKDFRMVAAKDGSYGMIFFMNDGWTVRRGCSVDEDPLYCPFGAETARIRAESDTARMSFPEFEKVFDLLNAPKTLNRVMLDIPGEIFPDIWRMMDRCAEEGVTPDAHIGRGVLPAEAETLARRCGRCVLDLPPDGKDACYDAAEAIADAAEAAGRKFFRTDIRVRVPAGGRGFAEEAAEDIVSDKRLMRVRTVLLSFAPDAGPEEYAAADKFVKEEIPFGCDECCAAGFEKYLRENMPERVLLYARQFMEECVYLRSSVYVDADGVLYPCPAVKGAEYGINLLSPAVSDFAKDVWNCRPIAEARAKAVARIRREGGDRCLYRGK